MPLVVSLLVPIAAGPIVPVSHAESGGDASAQAGDGGTTTTTTPDGTTTSATETTSTTSVTTSTTETTSTAPTTTSVTSTTATTATTTSTAPAPGTLSNLDLLFVRDAALNNVAEIELGQVAAALAADERVRAFGQRMVTEHTAQHLLLVDASSASGAFLPEFLVEPPPPDAPTSLGADPDFDVVYLKGQIQAHRRAIALFTAEANRGGAPELQTLARNSIPVLRDHLREARRLLKSLRGNGGNGGAGT
jgi:putative membrane protein